MPLAWHIMSYEKLFWETESWRWKSWIDALTRLDLISEMSICLYNIWLSWLTEDNNEQICVIVYSYLELHICRRQEIGHQVAIGKEQFSGNIAICEYNDCGADCIGKFAGERDKREGFNKLAKVWWEGQRTSFFALKKMSYFLKLQEG